MIMFEYTKLVLTKVSFDRNLFKKELIKSLRALQSEERQLLLLWCMSTFTLYQDIINEAVKSLTS